MQTVTKKGDVQTNIAYEDQNEPTHEEECDPEEQD